MRSEQQCEFGLANTGKLATVRFLSVEKCGEGEEGEAGRTQGS